VNIIKIIARWLLASVTLVPPVVFAASLSITVTDKAGNPVAGVVAVAMPTQKSMPSINATPVVMDQRDLQFVPSILPVHTGTPVVFPNSDPVAHQVYSFSSAKRFALGLYRGQQHAPVVFDHPGVVVLGCNIHDNMVGYIYVTDAPFFGMTDEKGAWRLVAAPAGEYRLQIWTPRLDDPNGLDRIVTIDEGHDSTVVFKVTQPLRALPVKKPHDKRLRDY
jgi:plastocyanin